MWILGRGGFLGTALAHEAIRTGYSVFPQANIPWGSPSHRESALRDTAERFSEFTRDTTAAIVWAAGSEGVGTTGSSGLSEIDSFRDFVNALSGVERLYGSRVTIVSSAGGVLGGSPAPPFNFQSPVNAISEYGQNKIAIEKIAANELGPNYQVHVARITNLYGPWPGPRQGLINRLCTAAATREAVQIYVSLDTIRDYIYVSDAAQLLLLEMAATLDFDSSDSPAISLIGSGENSSIGSVLNTVAHVAHRRIPVTMAQIAVTQLQPRDLRMHPSWIERGIPFAPLTLAQGVKRLFDSLVTVPRWS